MSKWAVVLIAGTIMLCPTILAQQDQGMISGIVTDQSGAAVPKAKVILQNEQTGRSFTATTSASGDYFFTLLPVGFYSLRVEAHGFKTEERQHIELHVQQKLNENFSLEVGATTQTVVVKGTVTPLQTGDASLGNVTDRRSIVNLPLNGRNIYQLVVLTPGASISPDGNPSISGQPSQQQSYLLDGTDNNNYQGTFQSGSPWNLQPSPDAVQEFKVQTNNYSAEFGRAGGGIVNVVTKGGTNQFHGDAYEFIRNAAFDGRNFFAPIKPRFDQNQFGGSVGGPFVLPHIYDGHNKTFFFSDYEGFRARTGTTQIANVPSTAWRNGDFQSLLTGQAFTDPCTGASYDTGQLFDPTTTRQVTCLDGGTGFVRNPVPGNIINPDEIVEPALKTAQLFPVPNLGSSQFVWSPALANDFNQFDVKVDHYWGTHDTISMRYNFRDVPPSGIPNIPGALGQGVTNRSRQQGAGFSDTHIFSSRTLNEFRYGYTRNAFTSALLNSQLNPASLGYGGLPYQPGLLGGVPGLSFSDVTSVGAAGFEPTLTTARDQVFIDTLSLVRGKHSFKVGGEYNSMWFTQYLSAFPAGNYSFNGVFTSDLNAPSGDAPGSGFAQFLFGMPSFASLSTSSLSDNGWQHAALFVQDDWKVNPKLTANLGLRWEFGNTERERFDRITGIDWRNGDFLIPISRKNRQPMLGPGFPVEFSSNHTLLTAANKNLGPRVGIAYQISHKTVIRGGFGIFYGYPYEPGTLAMPLNPPWGAQVNIQPPNAGVFDPVTGQPVVPVTSIVSGFPPGALENLAQTSELFLYTQAPLPYDWPTVLNWNFTAQQEIGGGITLQVAYAGTRGYHLTTGVDANQPFPSANPNSNPQLRRPFPTLGSFALVETTGYSNYDALQVTGEKHYSQGLSFVAGYTWSHALDDDPLFVLLNNTGESGDFYRDARNLALEYGNASFDVRQRFSLGWLYDLPWGRGRRFGNGWGGARNLLLGGWTLGGVEQAQTGFHFTPVSFVDPANSPTYQGVYRPNLVGNPTDFSYGQSVQAALGCPTGHQSIDCFFNPAAFALPAPGQFGNSGRNILTGPGLVGLDFTLHKDFSLGENKQLEFRTEVFNAINTPNFGNPDQGLQSPTFSRLLSAGAPREIQFVLMLKF